MQENRRGKVWFVVPNNVGVNLSHIFQKRRKVPSTTPLTPKYKGKHSYDFYRNVILFCLVRPAQIELKRSCEADHHGHRYRLPFLGHNCHCYRSTNFVILAILTLALKGSWHFRQLYLSGYFVCASSDMGSSAGTVSVNEARINFVIVMVVVLFQMDIGPWGEDRRFDGKRDQLGRLAIFWTFQAIWVWTVSLPVTVVNASDNQPSLQARDIIGWIMWVFGIIVEVTADQQKLAFKNSPENRGKWCDVGVWKYSRHPNYFGEIVLWWGIFVASTPVLKGAEWLVVFSPVFITLLLLFVSGLPLLEESADKKYGNLPEYLSYKRETSPLILLPPAVYGNLPQWFKTVFLFEFPLYNRNLPQELSWLVRAKSSTMWLWELLGGGQWRAKSNTLAVLCLILTPTYLLVFKHQPYGFIFLQAVEQAMEGMMQR
nr:uncharacterized protein LOC109150249 isoform X2 [Ipomoea batatas]